MSTSRLVDGVRLGRDVRTGAAGGAPLLREGTTITAEYRVALIRHGINAVYVDDQLSEGIDVPESLTERTRARAETALQRAYEEAPSALAGGGKMSEEAVDDLKRIAALIAAEVASSGDAVLALTDLAGADAYTLQHSIDVTVLGLVLGRRVLNLFGWPNYRGERIFTGVDERLTSLGVGLLLHDIGKLVVLRGAPEEGTARCGRVGLVRQHPDAGGGLLRGVPSAPSPRASSAAAPRRAGTAQVPRERRIPQFAGSPASPTSTTPARRTARLLRPRRIPDHRRGRRRGVRPRGRDGLPQGRGRHPAGTEVAFAEHTSRHRRVDPLDAPDQPTFASPTGPAACPPSRSTSHSPISSDRRRGDHPAAAWHLFAPRMAVRITVRVSPGAAPHRGRRPPR